MTFQHAISAILAVLIAALAFCLFMLVRNQWVFRQRMALIEREYSAYPRLATYNAMMWRFWVWNVEAFLSAQ